jgi:hypothetical protein
MMETMISPDMRTWVEAAVTKYVRDLIPAEQTHVFLVRRVLAQLLWYWRYEVPLKWQSSIIDLDYSLFAIRLQEATIEDLGFRRVDANISQVYSALDSSDWDTIASLPEPVWNWITDLTGLSLRQWEGVPNAVLELVDQDIICPRCEKTCDLREVGELVSITDPFSCHGSNKPSFACERCGTHLVFDMFGLSDEPRPQSRWNSLLMKRAAGIAVAVVVVYYLWRRLIF